MKDSINQVAIKISSISKRTKAFIIDDLLVTFLSIAMLWGPITNANGDLEIIINIMNQALVQIILLKVAYQTFFVWYYGATIGKIYTKIKIVNMDNSRVGFLQSLVRAVIRLISENLFYIGFIIAYFMPYRQTLHDKISKTIVVDV